ncbi:MAG: MFS transporter [Lentisphaerae bacterium]|nr:MAG: MFS transporter [Lentisphaerota bacterium]
MNTTRENRTAATRRGELLRVIFTAPTATAFQSSGVGLVIALKYFNAADWQKAIIASAGTAGLLLTPVAVYIAGRLRLPVSKIIGSIIFLGIPGLLLAAFSRQLTTYMTGLLASLLLLASTTPLITSLWRQNAGVENRGKFFGQVAFAGVLTGLLSSGLISWFMREDLSRFRIIFMVLACLLACAALAVIQIPSNPLDRHSAGNPFRNLSLIWKNKLFGYMCIIQMLVGIGNLATNPLRTEYAGSSVRGLGYSPGMILVLGLLLPEIGRAVSMLVWGKLFDRMNFMLMRALVNLFFILSIVLFFTPVPLCQILGSLAYGLAIGGGHIAWNLWVTRFCESEETAAYMSVHTALTGLRGILAPQLAFGVLKFCSIQTVAWSGALLILLSILLLIPVLPRGKTLIHT